MLTKTISNRSVFGEKEKVLELVMSDKTKEHFLYRVFGVIDGYARGRGRFKRVNPDTQQAEDTYWTKFSGDFKAVTGDGEVFEAATAFLPNYVSGQFTTALDNDGEATIEFAYDIFAVYSKASATSYEYLAQPVKKTTEENKLATMEKEMLALPIVGKDKALPAPKSK